jgi:hypothetical protein
MGWMSETTKGLTMANIWTEAKVHIAKDGTHRPICGASGNGNLKVKVAYASVPNAVTCQRCVRIFLNANNKLNMGDAND